MAGHGRGGPLGFPTANLEVPVGMAVPRRRHLRGVGARRWRAPHGGCQHRASAPTFGDGGRAVEAFILDFDGDLYGREVGLEFVCWLRPETKFDTVEALQEQVRRDVAGTRAILEQGRAASGSAAR